MDNVTAIFLGFPKFKTDKDNFTIRNVSKSTDLYKRIRDKERTTRMTNKITIDPSKKNDKSNKISIKEVEDNSNSNIINEKENLSEMKEKMEEFNMVNDYELQNNNISNDNSGNSNVNNKNNLQYSRQRIQSGLLCAIGLLCYVAYDIYMLKKKFKGIPELGLVNEEELKVGGNQGFAS